MKPIVFILTTLLSLFFITTETYAAQQNERFFIKASQGNHKNNQRIVTRIPKAAKERDIKLIQQFMDHILKGDEAGARYLASDGGDNEAQDRINYSSEKIARLNIFNNPKARIDAIYYYQDIITDFKHLRYYFVIYENGQHRYPEVMKIEMINYDDLFYLNRFWAPR